MSLESMLSENHIMKHSILGEDDDELDNDYDREEEVSLLNKMIAISKKILKYKDLLFLITFLIQLLVIFSLAMSYGIKGLSTITNTVIIDSNNSQRSSSTSSISFLFGIFISIVSSIFISLFWAFFISYYANDIIVFTLSSIIFTAFALGLFFFINASILWGVGLMLIACCIIGIFVYLKPRIHFATVMLRISIVALKEMPSTVVIAIAIMIIEFVYILLWSIAVYGYASYHKKTMIAGYPLSNCRTYDYTNSLLIGSKQLICPSGQQQSCHACFCQDQFIVNDYCSMPQVYARSYFLFLLSLFWSTSVASNIIYTTMAGCISTWWTDIYKPSSTVVKKCFIRSISTSLGSISCGSLLCAMIKTIRTIVNFLSRSITYLEINNQGIIFKIRNYIIAILKRMLLLVDHAAQYFSGYAFVYLALYDLSFFQASQKVVSLFYEKGLTIVVNDEIIEGILYLTSIFVGVVTLLIAHLYSSHMAFNSADSTLLAIIAFVCGFCMSKIAFTLLTSSVSTIMVLFIESPEIFQSTNPLLYNELSKAWKGIYPTNMMNADDIESDLKPKGPYIPPQVIAGAYKTLPTNENFSNLPVNSHNNPANSQNDYIPSFLNNFLNINENNNEAKIENSSHSEIEDDEEEVSL